MKTSFAGLPHPTAGTFFRALHRHLKHGVGHGRYFRHEMPQHVTDVVAKEIEKMFPVVRVHGVVVVGVPKNMLEVPEK